MRYSGLRGKWWFLHESCQGGLILSPWCTASSWTQPHLCSLTPRGSLPGMGLRGKQQENKVSAHLHRGRGGKWLPLARQAAVCTAGRGSRAGFALRSSARWQVCTSSLPASGHDSRHVAELCPELVVGAALQHRATIVGTAGETPLSPPVQSEDE